MTETTPQIVDRVDASNAARASTAPASSPIVRAIKRAIGQPQFLVAFVVLFVAALSLSAATQYLRLYFKKEPVALTKPLDQIPPSLGPWVQVSRGTELNEEMQDVLGTKQYIFRDYVDSRQIDAPTIAKFKDQTDEENARLLSKLQAQNPSAGVRLSVTYYTGMVDTVAHIPDRCYVADGQVPDAKETPLWTLANQAHQPIPVRVSSIHFESEDSNSHGPTKNVAYFFHCNGNYEFDAITGVRVRLQNLTERHAYYAKIEVLTQMQDRAKSDQVIQDFLISALPEIEACLPDWDKVKLSEKADAKAAPATNPG